MAQLRDTIVQGSARVTDTLYANTMKATTLNVDSLETSVIEAPANLLIKVNKDSSIITLANFSSTAIEPGITTAARYIGTSSARWDGIYGKNANFSDNVTISGTLTLSKTTDASGTANNSPALIVGGTSTTNPHLEFDGNEIMSKTSGTAVGDLYLNADGGRVHIGNMADTATTTANNSTGLLIKGVRGTNNPLIKAVNTFQSNSGYQWGLDHQAINAQAGANTCILTGVANSANNQGVLEFHYAGSNDAGNYVGLGLYSNNGLIKAFKDKHVEVDTLKITNTSGVAHLTFSRTANPNYIVVPDSKYLIINNGTTIGTAYAALGIQKTEIYNAFGGNIGTSTYYWGNIYAKGYIYMKGQNQYPLDFFLYNKSGNQVGEMWYDHGATDTVTTGKFAFREFSPASTAAATTSGKHETFYLPTVNTGRTDNATYTIITTKNLSSITTVGTITSGTWNGTAIDVSHGGTGAGTFTADCVIVGNGTNAMASRGLKVTGAVDSAVTISPSTTDKTFKVSSTSTLYLNSKQGASIVFQQNDAEVARFNINGNLALGVKSDGTAIGTQNTHKLYVSGASCFNGKIAFGAQASNVITEKMYMQYDTTTDILNFVFV